MQVKNVHWEVPVWGCLYCHRKTTQIILWICTDNSPCNGSLTTAPNQRVTNATKPNLEIRSLDYSYSQIRFSLLLLNHGNKLSPQLRNAPTLNRFKQATKNQTIKPLKFYNAGCRILYIFHNKLRHRHKFTKTLWGRRLFTPGFLVTLVSTRLQWWTRMRRMLWLAQ